MQKDGFVLELLHRLGIYKIHKGQMVLANVMDCQENLQMEFEK
jgi:hypothetical protein